MFNSLIAKGIVLMLLSTIFFALMNAIIKYLNILGYSSMENVFFRAFFMVLSVWSLVAFAPVIRAILPRYKMPQIRAKKSGGFRHILIRGVLGGIAVSANYYNFATIPLGLATAFLQSTPIFVVLLSLFTHNKPSLFTIIATLIGFSGVLLVANPSSSNIPPINALVGIIAAICAACAFMTIHNLKSFYTSEAVVLWYGVTMCAVGAIGMCADIDKMGGFVIPNLLAWVLFVLSGILGTIGQWLMTKSYMFASPDIVSPIAYMRIVWSLFLGVALGDALPNFMPSLGIALILLSGALVAFGVYRQKRGLQDLCKSSKSRHN